MEYRYHNGNFLNEFLKTNNLKEEDLDTSSFHIDITQDKLLEFKEKLESIKDLKTLLIGDYDCDGICSTAIIKRLLEHLDINHNFYIPSRNKDGYGLNEAMVEMAYENHFEAIIAVDNGVSASETLLQAKSKNIKVLIIDHHEYKTEPDCFGFIHPTLLKESYNNLSAGGLSYLVSKMFYDDELSLVYGGLSTLADMVGVLGFNRYLIKESLNVLNKGHIYQINLLNGENKYDFESLSFNVIPKVNAISRMNYNPNILVKYLLANKETCLSTIESIEKINNERKETTIKQVNIAKKIIDKDEKICVVVSREFSEGICGLLANKLISEVNKPVIVLSLSDGLLKGSCRSVNGFNIYSYLSEFKDLFDSFGGHELACGITLKLENLDKLKQAIASSTIEYRQVIEDVYEINSNSLNMSLLSDIESLKPFGKEIKEPKFVLKDVDYKRMILVAKKYPKFIVNDSASAISFNPKYVNYPFKEMIGNVKKDNYYSNKVSFLIEDLI